MALNKKRLDRTRKSTKGNSKFYKFEDGRNIIRVFSFPHEVTQLDFDKGIYKKSDGVKIGQKFDEIERKVLKHYTEEGIVNCPKVNCRWCDESAKLLKSRSKNDKKAGKDLSASQSFAINVVDIQSDSKELKIGQLPSTVYDAVLSYVCDVEYGESILGCTGRDFIVDKDKNQTPAKMYVTKIRDKDKCEELEKGDFIPVDLFYVNALEPGYSSVDELNTFEDRETNEEKEERLKGENKKESKATTTTKKRGSRSKKEENPFKDGDNDDGGKMPWEEKGNSKTIVIELQDIVSFEDDGETLQGQVVEIGEETYAIKDKDGILDIPIDELTLVKKAAKAKGRRRRG